MAQSRDDRPDSQHSRQFQRTDREIRNALLTLLDYKPFEKITVQDILDEAMINRSTFYQHYPDKYAVIEQLQRLCLGELDGIFQKIMEQSRNGGRQDFPEMDKQFGAFFTKNRSTLQKLMRIRTTQFDIREAARQDFSAYFRRLLPPESAKTPETELEIHLLAGFYLNFLEFFVDHTELPGGYTTSLYNAFLEITRTFFRLESPQARKALDDLINTYALR